MPMHLDRNFAKNCAKNVLKSLLGSYFVEARPFWQVFGEVGCGKLRQIRVKNLTALLQTAEKEVEVLEGSCSSKALSKLQSPSQLMIIHHNS